MDAQLRRAFVGMAAVLGLGVVAGVAAQGPQRLGVLVGTLLVVATGVVSLLLKRRAVQRGLKEAMAAMVWVLCLRMVCVFGGVMVLRLWEGAVPWFVAGFFVPYLAAQAIEVRYVLAGAKSGPARSE
ncbi:MAG: hypothetical protein L0Y66_00310 [Myxococcaceae bacterium]|nr:hypothetical protein [Myxococcaceae bacterium]MCI0671157.1 hypothetical protein [Myxococcaceae bacterium]